MTRSTRGDESKVVVVEIMACADERTPLPKAAGTDALDFNGCAYGRPGDESRSWTSVSAFQPDSHEPHTYRTWFVTASELSTPLQCPRKKKSSS
jgi:hypothetical protein